MHGMGIRHKNCPHVLFLLFSAKGTLHSFFSPKVRKGIRVKLERTATSQNTTSKQLPQSHRFQFQTIFDFCLFILVCLFLAAEKGAS